MLGTDHLLVTVATTAWGAATAIAVVAAAVATRARSLKLTTGAQRGCLRTAIQPRLAILQILSLSPAATATCCNPACHFLTHLSAGFMNLGNPSTNNVSVLVFHIYTVFFTYKTFPFYLLNFLESDMGISLISQMRKLRLTGVKQFIQSQVQ